MLVMARLGAGVADVVPASTLPWRGMAPVRARIASRSVVLPLGRAHQRDAPGTAADFAPLVAMSSPGRFRLTWSVGPLVGRRTPVAACPRPADAVGKRQTTRACVFLPCEACRPSSSEGLRTFA